MKMTKAEMVRQAMEFNRCAIILRKQKYGKLPESIAAFCERRDYLIKLARSI